MGKNDNNVKPIQFTPESKVDSIFIDKLVRDSGCGSRRNFMRVHFRKLRQEAEVKKLDKAEV